LIRLSVSDCKRPIGKTYGNNSARRWRIAAEFSFNNFTSERARQESNLQPAD
jgi:hypothetical protein